MVGQSVRHRLGHVLVLGVGAQVRALADVGREVEEAPEWGRSRCLNRRLSGNMGPSREHRVEGATVI